MESILLVVGLVGIYLGTQLIRKRVQTRPVCSAPDGGPLRWDAREKAQLIDIDGRTVRVQLRRRLAVDPSTALERVEIQDHFDEVVEFQCPCQSDEDWQLRRFDSSNPFFPKDMDHRQDTDIEIAVAYSAASANPKALADWEIKSSLRDLIMNNHVSMVACTDGRLSAYIAHPLPTQLLNHKVVEKLCHDVAELAVRIEGNSQKLLR